MNGFAKRTEQKKQAIKQAVLDLLKTSDPREMKISDIAKKANVSQVTIYNHFGSKEQLIREVIIDYVMKQVEKYEEFLKENCSFQEKVEYIIFEKKKLLEQIRVDVFQRLIQEDEEVRRVVDMLYQTRVIPLFVEMIKEAQEKREIDPRLSIDTLLFYVSVWMEIGEKIPPSMYDERLTEELVRLFFYGVKGAERHEGTA
jgi:AcrR family transcriptional regulator